MDSSFNEIFYTVPEDMREERLQEVRNTETFRTFIEKRPYEEQLLLFDEINKVLEGRIPLSEFMYVWMSYDESEDKTDYRKIAIFCFVEIMDKLVQENRERTQSLAKTPDFLATYEETLSQIVDYLENRRSVFPEEALRCLFLLTDEDIDAHRQGLTATRLTVDSFSFCSSDEQKEEIERLIKNCMI